MKDNVIRVRNLSSLKIRRKELRKNQTNSEKILWQRLRNRGLNSLKFFRQYSVGPYVLDFYCPEIHLAIELDGDYHMEKESKKYDQERTRYLESNGVQVLRFQNNEVLRSLEEVIKKVIEKCHNAP